MKSPVAPQVQAGERPLRHDDVRLVPDRNIGRVARQPAAAPRCTARAAPLRSGRRRRVEQPIDLGVPIVAAVEPRRRHLRRVEDAPQDVGIDQRASDPLQAEQLKPSLQHVLIEGRELVGPDVEVDADAPQVLLDDGRLEPRFLVGRESATAGGAAAGRRRRGRGSRPRPGARVARAGSKSNCRTSGSNAHACDGTRPVAGRASPRRRWSTMAWRSMAWPMA